MSEDPHQLDPSQIYRGFLALTLNSKYSLQSLMSKEISEKILKNIISNFYDNEKDILERIYFTWKQFIYDSEFRKIEDILQFLNEIYKDKSKWPILI